VKELLSSQDLRGRRWPWPWSRVVENLSSNAHAHD